MIITHYNMKQTVKNTKSLLKVLVFCLDPIVFSDTHHIQGSYIGHAQKKELTCAEINLNSVFPIMYRICRQLSIRVTGNTSLELKLVVIQTKRKQHKKEFRISQKLFVFFSSVNYYFSLRRIHIYKFLVKHIHISRFSVISFINWEAACQYEATSDVKSKNTK